MLDKQVLKVGYTQCILLLLCLITLQQTTHADVVKPALIEINVSQVGEINIELRASIEAMLTGINNDYKNTQDAPTAEAYDVLRAMSADQLDVKFKAFQGQLLERIALRDQRGKKIALVIQKLQIPEPGYTKVPRNSVIHLVGRLPKGANALTWYYPKEIADNAVRLRQIDEHAQQWHWSQWQWLRHDQVSDAFSLTEIVAPSAWYTTAWQYIELGFVHIVPKGLDHILFILGLFFFSRQFKPLMWQVAMFTLAHTITLGLSMLGWISLPAHIVEPLIALSIVYVALENIWLRQARKHRLLLIFGFGLLHGLGFASVLTELGMPQGSFVLALLSFNLGVELGQVLVLLSAFVLFNEPAQRWLTPKWSHAYHYYLRIPASAMIALVASFWFIERVPW